MRTRGAANQHHLTPTNTGGTVTQNLSFAIPLRNPLNTDHLVGQKFPL